jgi:MYXO-CTERM domain-containing protein
VHVFRLTGDAWTHELRVAASDAEPGDQFGTSLALDGEWMIAGSPSRARGPYEDPRHGGAYVARLSGLPEPDAGVDADGGVGTDGSVALPDGGPGAGDPDGGSSEGGGSGGCSCATTSSDGAPSSVVFLFGVTLLALRPSRKRRRASSHG